MTEEKLIVEFGVEMEIPRDYGYVEKYLTHNGNKTQYKAITKNGELLAIVSRKYHLIENERVIEICEEIAKKNGLKIDVVETPCRVHIFLDKDDKGVVVHNSVDASYAFRIDAVVRLGNTKVVIKVRDVEQVYKKHFKNAKLIVDELEEIVKEIFKKADEFKHFIHKLEVKSAREFYEDLKSLEDLLPKKYIGAVLQAIAQRRLDGRYMSLKEVYEKIASNIWSADIDMKTKVQYFDNLNQVMFALVGWE